jgi:small GTP-binding protein
LDRLEVEKRRGITVKACAASMFHTSNGGEYLLNLIDTPGHIDFTYEVSRSLKACQGCILVVDATQGVQAQTIANFFLAFELGIKIIPVLNKIDLKTARIKETEEQLYNTLDIKSEEIIRVSAKTGLNCDAVLNAIVERLPP